MPVSCVDPWETDTSSLLLLYCYFECSHLHKIGMIGIDIRNTYTEVNQMDSHVIDVWPHPLEAIKGSRSRKFAEPKFNCPSDVFIKAGIKA